MVGLSGLLCIVCLYDYKKKKIPNPLVLSIMIMGAVRGMQAQALWGLSKYLIASVVVIFLLYPLFRIGGLGAGDVKLMGVCAGFFPVEKILNFLIVSLLFSAVFSIFKLFQEKSIRDRVIYFGTYCRELISSRRWSCYRPRKGDVKLEGICMAGPVLCSVFLGLGGVY